MKPRQKRIALIVGGLASLGIAAALALNALDSNIALYVTPSEVAAARRRRARPSASAAWSRKVRSNART
jgi:cytochrome c-type biogenesis protein CcmE